MSSLQSQNLLRGSKVFNEYGIFTASSAASIMRPKGKEPISSTRAAQILGDMTANGELRKVSHTEWQRVKKFADILRRPWAAPPLENHTPNYF